LNLYSFCCFVILYKSKNHSIQFAFFVFTSIQVWLFKPEIVASYPPPPPSPAAVGDQVKTEEPTADGAVASADGSTAPPAAPQAPATPAAGSRPATGARASSAGGAAAAAAAAAPTEPEQPVEPAEPTVQFTYITPEIIDQIDVNEHFEVSCFRFVVFSSNGSKKCHPVWFM
jgi:hypothetical protein